MIEYTPRLGNELSLATTLNVGTDSIIGNFTALTAITGRMSISDFASGIASEIASNLTQDDIVDGATYVRTHNDLTDSLLTALNSAIQPLDNVSELTNNSGFISDLSGFTTDDLNEGTNLYSQWVTDGSDIYFTGGNVNIGTNSPLVISSSANYFSDVTPLQELRTGNSSDEYEECIVIRHAEVSEDAVIRRLGILFKMEAEHTSYGYVKYGGIILESENVYANNPNLYLLTGDQKRLKISDGGDISFFETKTGTLVSPPLGLTNGMIWKDTTDSTTHPILRISTTTT